MSFSVLRTSTGNVFDNKIFLRGISTDVMMRIVNTASPSANALTISGTGAISTSGGYTATGSSGLAVTGTGTVAVTTADSITSASIIVPVNSYINSVGWAAGGAATQLIWTAREAFTVVSIVENCFPPASAQADFTVARTRGGAADVQQLTAAISLNGATAKTPVVGTLVGGATNQLSTSDGISVTLTGAATALANGEVTIMLQRR